MEMKRIQATLGLCYSVRKALIQHPTCSKDQRWDSSTVNIRLMKSLPRSLI